MPAELRSGFIFGKGSAGGRAKIDLDREGQRCRRNWQRVLTSAPVAPRGQSSVSFSAQQGPAMSIWAHGTFGVTNSSRNNAAVIVPADLPPTFFRSATVL